MFCIMIIANELYTKQKLSACGLVVCSQIILKNYIIGKDRL